MGWKSTIDLTRREAILAIVKALDKTPYDDMSNEDMMSKLDIGDNPNLPYYGHNFTIIDNE